MTATSFAAVVRAEDAHRMLASVTASTGMAALDAREDFARARRAQYRARLGSGRNDARSRVSRAANCGVPYPRQVVTRGEAAGVEVETLGRRRSRSPQSRQHCVPRARAGALHPGGPGGCLPGSRSSAPARPGRQRRRAEVQRARTSIVCRMSDGRSRALRSTSRRSSCSRTCASLRPASSMTLSARSRRACHMPSRSSSRRSTYPSSCSMRCRSVASGGRSPGRTFARASIGTPANMEAARASITRGRLTSRRMRRTMGAHGGGTPISWLRITVSSANARPRPMTSRVAPAMTRATHTRLTAGRPRVLVRGCRPLA
jgi:hypothetical protein